MEFVTPQPQPGNNASAASNLAYKPTSSLLEPRTKTLNGTSTANPTSHVPSTDPSLGTDTLTDAAPPQQSATPQATAAIAASQPSIPSIDVRGPERNARSRGRESHAMDLQKHAWYYSSLGMGKKHVQDEWGFSSTSASRDVSRSHSPAVEGRNG